jgi:malate dehydrogenase
MTLSIVGSGKVGAFAALSCGLRELDKKVLLLDIVKGLPQGEAMDINHQLAERGSDCSVHGSNEYEEMRGSDVVVIVAGMGRKPGMTRMDLLQVNAEIVRTVASKVALYAKEAKLIVVTNPLDPMTFLALRTTLVKKSNVMGMGGMLDLSRFKDFIHNYIRVSRKSIDSMVIGEHGENMLPLTRFSSISGIPLEHFISKDQAKDIFDKTRQVAAEVISLKGATVFAPGNAITYMIEAIVKDKKALIPASTLLEGEYGLTDLCIGVPVVIGRNGVEKIVELELNSFEQDIFNKGAQSIREAINSLGI